MKQVVIILVLSLCWACKKEPAKYCPIMITGEIQGEYADLAAVAHIPQIMDTLAKYPQLRPYRVKFGYGVASGSSYANVASNIYYKNLIIFNKDYYLFWDSYGTSRELTKTYPIPTKVGISIEPAISAEKANAIAEKTMHYSNCALSQLGLLDVGTDSIPQYKLIWRIMGAEGGYPIVNLDAQSGEVLSSSDGIIYD